MRAASLVTSHPSRYRYTPTSDVSVFDLSTRAFTSPLKSNGRELLCLSFDRVTSRLVALVDGIVSAGRLSLVKWSGDEWTADGTLPALPAELTVARVLQSKRPVCSLSQATGILALQLVRLDPTAVLFAATEELHVLRVDQRNRSDPSVVKVDVTSSFGPPGAGRSWRLVEPFVHFSD